MKKTVLLASLLFTSLPAAAQAPTSGGTTYGGPQTVSCLQGGQIIFQIPYAWAVATSWTEASYHLEYNDPDGARQIKDFNPQAMTCLIEPFGQSSLPTVRKR